MYERSVDLEEEFRLLMGLMEGMITAQASQPPEPTAGCDHSIHTLAVKLFMHLSSARTLLEPSGHGYIDHSSIAVLTRSAIENFLVISWLNASGDQSLRHFRHRVWEYSGLKKRGKLFASEDFSRARRQQAISRAADLLHQIKGSPHFLEYEPEQRKSIRKGKWEAGTHWNDLAVEAGLHRTYFTSLYPYLSGYVHSDYISSLQIQQADDVAVQYELGTGPLRNCLILIAHFCHLYAEIFTAAKLFFESRIFENSLAEKWYISAEAMNSIYGSDDTSIKPEVGR